MVRLRTLMFAALLASCGFDPRGATGDAAAIDGPPGDGAADAPAIDAPAIDALAVDARPLDAAVDAAPTCPTGYDVVAGTSRYAYRSTPSTVAAAMADCDGDLAGRTHLATFEGANLDAVLTASPAPNNEQIYVGARCTTTGAACDLRASWVWMNSGSAVDTGLWRGLEPSGQFTLAYGERASGTWELVSSAGMIARPYLCECDP